MIETEIKNWVIPTSSYIPTIAKRLYVNQLPDSVTYPCAVLYSISRNEMHECDFFTERFQFSCYAVHKSSATEIADSIKDRLKRFYGKLSTASNYTVVNSVMDNLVYLYDSNSLKHVEILDMLITYRRV